MPDLSIEPYLAISETEITERYRARTPRSAAAWERARTHLPGGVTRTISYHRPYPLYLDSGSGCYVRDLDRHEYVDFNNNFGTLVLGHADSRVTAATHETLLRGASFGAPTELEDELATAILNRVPWASQVRFNTSGTEAAMFATRIARAATGRATIVKMVSSYHGLSDTLMVRADAEAADSVVGEGLPGALAGTVVHLPYNDDQAAAELLDRLGSEVAAVIVEPLMGSGGMVPATPSFLRTLREATRRVGAWLIVDEVITFRLANGGLHQMAGIQPDLMVIGKLIGGGLPIGSVVGDARLGQLLDPSAGQHALYHSGTFAGTPAAMAAGAATLEAFDEAAIERLNIRGDQLRAELDALFQRKSVPLRTSGFGSVFQIHVTDAPVTSPPPSEHRLRFFPLFLGLLTEGIMLTYRGSGCLSTPMGEAEMDGFVGALDRLLKG